MGSSETTRSNILALVICAVLCLLSTSTADCPRKCKCSRYKTTCFNSKLNGLPRSLENSTEFVRVENDNIAELNENTISQALPRTLKELQLVNINLRAINNYTFQNMELLELLLITGNNINSLIAETFKGLRMVYKLDLSQNCIIYLEPGVFDGLASLRHLNLSYNCIKILKHGIFYRMRSINRLRLFRSMLDISNNEIEYIESGAFQDASVFTDVNIEGCNALPFLVGMFKGLNGIKTLHVTNRNSLSNKHVSLTKDVLQGISTLHALILRNSSIYNIENTTFESFSLLFQLDLSENFISTLRRGAFFGLSSLKLLELQKNSIYLLENYVFYGVPSLRTLSLNQCKIRIILSEAFKGLVQLRFLDLSENRISELASQVFSDLITLKELALFGNNLINLDGLSKLASLKSLNLANAVQNSVNHNVFQSLQRLDDLRIGTTESEIGQQVLRTLVIYANFDINQMSTVGGKLDRVLQGIQYWHELKLKISKINHTPQIGDISKFRFTSIDMSHNFLPFFVDIIFKNQTSLKSLKLSHCSIKVILAGMFQDLEALAELDLSYNSGTKLRYGTFLGLNHLKQLNLSFSKMDSLDIGAFVGLDNLQLLDLSANQISSLDAGVFDGLNRINILNLSDNSITTVGAGVFGAECEGNFNGKCEISAQYCNTSHVLMTLQILDLSYNDVKDIHPHAFLYCNSLQELYLNNNGMLTLGTDFLRTPALRILNVNNCYINELPATFFACAKMLSEIQLSFNKIQNINIVESFGNLLNIKQINVSGNPIICNCQQQTMVQWLRDRYLVYRKKYTFYFSGHSLCDNDSIETSSSILECIKSLSFSHDTSKYNIYHVTFFNRNIQPIVLNMILLTGFLVNCFLLYTFLAYSELRTCPNICIVSLAIAHLLFIIFFISFRFSDILHDTGYLNSWKLLVIIKNMVVGVTVFVILLMSVQKFLILHSISRPVSQLRLYQKKVTIFLNVMVWILAIGTTVIICSSKQGIISSSKSTQYFRLITTSKLIVYCLVPITAVISLEASNYRLLLETISILRGNPDKYTERFLNITIILAFIFILSYFPHFLIEFLVAWSIDGINTHFSHTIFAYLFFSNSILNPVVIFIMMSKYKQVFIKYFGSHLDAYNEATFNYGRLSLAEDNEAKVAVNLIQ